MNGDDAVVTVIAMLQLAQWATKQVEQYQNGELTAAELEAAYLRMKVRVDAANELWESV